MIRRAVMIRRVVMWTGALLLLAASACSTRNSALQADAWAVAEKQWAMTKLQQMPRPTPEQDRIDRDIAADFQFIQEHRARWAAAPDTMDQFDKAVWKAILDPKMRELDPFQVSETNAPVPAK